MILLAKRSTRWIFAERVVFAGLLSLLALVPLPFGAVRPWAWSLFAGFMGVLTLGWGVLAACSGSNQPASIRPILPAVGLFTLVVAWIALQASGLMPPEWRHPLWRATETALGVPVGGAISLDEHQTWTAMMRLVWYGAVFLLSYQLCMATDRSERLIRILIGMTLIYACYGMAVQSAGIDKVLWYDKAEGQGHLSSTFLDRHSFAVYAGLGLLCALALLFRPKMRRGDLAASWRFRARAIADFFFARSWSVMLCASVLFVAILMTHSEIGLSLALLGAGAYLAMIAWVRDRKTVAVIACGVAAVAVYSLVSLGNGAPGDPSLGYMHEAGVGPSYAPELNAIVDAPFLGTGYGTHDQVVAMQRTDDGGQGAASPRNAFLAAALELGVPAAVALLLSLGWVVLICFASVLRHRRRAVVPCLGVAATVVAVAAGAVDDGFRIPAIAATYAAILGAACAQSLRLEIPEHTGLDRRGV